MGMENGHEAEPTLRSASPNGSLGAPSETGMISDVGGCGCAYGEVENNRAR